MVKSDDSAGVNSARYQEIVRRRVADPSISAVIPLELNLLDEAERGTGVCDLAELLEVKNERRVVLLGNPGAGKSTIIKRYCLKLLDSENGALPIFIDLKRYRGPSRDVNALVGRQLSLLSSSADQALERVGVVVFDGLNEVPEGLLNDALADIDDFMEEIDPARTAVVLTCRSVNFPLFHTSFSRYEVRPVSESAAVEYLIKRLGAERGQNVWRSLPGRMKGLCRLPLLLSMVAYLVLEDPDSEANLPRTRTAVYTGFLRALDQRTRDTVVVRTPEDIRSTCLAIVAYSMQNASVEIPVLEIREAITSNFDKNWGVLIAVLQSEVLDLPPMGAVERETGAFATRQFMHQSFQEYYTAVYLKAALDGRVGKIVSLSDLGELVRPEAIAWRETFGYLSGMLSDSTILVSACRRHRNPVLAAACIEQANFVSAEEVDDFICDTLEQFKYGAAFEYELMFCLQRILDWRTSDFPARVVDDIEYWCEKYSRVTPQEIGGWVTDEELWRLAIGGTRQDRIDAIWTLGQRAREHSIPLLEELARTDPDDLVREFSVVALGRIASGSSLELLQAVASDTGETRWMRSYAIHSIGCYARSDAVESLVQYLREPELADDAAWALSELAKVEPTLIVPVVDSLLSVLYSEADRYTKGCVLYTISSAGATSALASMIEYLEQESSPYVLEDGCHALGELNASSGLALLSRLAHRDHCSDPMTRRQALLALIKLGKEDDTVVNLARLDPVPYVRKVVNDVPRGPKRVADPEGG